MDNDNNMYAVGNVDNTQHGSGMNLFAIHFARVMNMNSVKLQNVYARSAIHIHQMHTAQGTRAHHVRVHLCQYDICAIKIYAILVRLVHSSEGENGLVVEA